MKKEGLHLLFVLKCACGIFTSAGTIMSSYSRLFDILTCLCPHVCVCMAHLLLWNTSWQHVVVWVLPRLYMLAFTSLYTPHVLVLSCVSACVWIYHACCFTYVSVYVFWGFFRYSCGCSVKPLRYFFLFATALILTTSWQVITTFLEPFSSTLYMLHQTHQVLLLS